LSFEYFISKKVLKSEVQGKKVSRPIVRISIISITLAVVVNLITIAVVTGFQHEVREKVSGFGSHIFIMSSGENSIYESEPILKNQAFLSILNKDPELKNIQYIAYKPVLFQSNKKDRQFKLKSGKDTSYVQQEIQGAILKGIDYTYDLSFFKQHLKTGRLPKFSKDSISNEIIISKRIAQDLNLEIGEEVKAFFVKNQPVKRIFKLVGIYETGLEEFDKKMAIGDIRIVQELNDWGIKASIIIADTLSNGELIVKADVSGGNGNYRYDWGKGYEQYSGFTICPTKDTIIRLIISDYWMKISGENEQTSIPDTAYLKIKIKGTGFSACDFKVNNDRELIRTYLNDIGSKYSLSAMNKTLLFEQIIGNGSSSNYVGGFEVSVKDWNKLPETVNRLKKQLELIPTTNNESLSVKSIIDTQSDIFVWLGFLDLNVVIILTLMILIGIINMGSALLVLILVRTNFIGIMKSMGASNWSIRKIFLIQAAFLIIRGMFYGNLIGLSLCALQYFFGIITLNPEVYYLSQVPVELTFFSWALLNIGTLIVCLSALIIPSVVITRINPVKAIRFN
jgi:lipoprotein-releasing system permease protein